ncbi:MAG: hypothetical protein GC164_10295 [Phycisphaera sp.]|nr:hypothetical protein [Phycisphaera sp.]
MQEPQKKNWWRRNGFWVVPTAILVPVAGCVGFVWLLLSLIFGIIKSSDAYTHSLAAAQADARVQQAIGSPIHAGMFVTGNINVNGSSGNADISYTVTGPNGQGTLYVTAYKAVGQWTFTSLVFMDSKTGQRIDLLTSP